MLTHDRQGTHVAPDRRAVRLVAARAVRVVALLLFCAGLAHAGAAVRIVSPASGETVHDNRGNVPVELVLDAPYHAVRVLLDGKPTEPLQRSARFTLRGVHRGEHTLQVQLIDSGGNVLARSEPVTFHMWQASKLFPSRQ